MATECCGDIEIAYYRSKDGKVIHRADCTRKGGAIGWHYAARVHGNGHAAILREIDSIPWLQACRYCMAVSA